MKKLLEIGPYCETGGVSIHIRRLAHLLSTDFIVDIIDESKYVLKKIAEKYSPKKIIYRQKASFGAPTRSWISGDLRNLTDEHLSQEKVEKSGLFNYGYVNKLITNDRLGIEDNGYKIYQLLTSELWFKEIID